MTNPPTNNELIRTPHFGNRITLPLEILCLIVIFGLKMINTHTNFIERVGLLVFGTNCGPLDFVHLPLTSQACCFVPCMVHVLNCCNTCFDILNRIKKIVYSIAHPKSQNHKNIRLVIIISLLSCC